MGRTAAASGRARFREDCIALLRQPQREPGVLIAESGAPDTARAVALGRNDFLTEGRQPTELELLWCGRVLVRLLARPGKCSEPVLRRLAWAVVTRRFRTTDPSEVDDLVQAAVVGFVQRRHPGRDFWPSGATLNEVIDNVRSYVATACYYHAVEGSRRERLLRGETLNPSIEAGGGEDYEDRLIACIDGDSDGEWEGYAGPDAPTEGQVADPGTLTEAALAKRLGRPRTTTMSAVERAKKAGMVIAKVGASYAIREDQVEEIASHLRPPRKAYVRKRRPFSARYPKGVRTFPDDFPDCSAVDSTVKR